MSTTTNPPDILEPKDRDRAIRSDLVSGVAAASDALARRREFTQRFVSGEIGVELAGIESSREADRCETAASDDRNCK